MKRTLFILLIFSILINLPAKEKIGKDLDFAANFHTEINSEDILSDYYSLGGDLKFYFEPGENWEFKLKLEADTKDIKMDELRFKYVFNESWVKFGMYKNSLFVDDSLNSTEHPFVLNSLVIARVEDMGWYSSSGIGATYRSGRIGNLQATVTTLLDSAIFSPMATATLDYLIGPHESSIGLNASYIQIIAPYSPQGYYYMFNGYIANLNDQAKWNYKADITFGNNIGDPAGYTHYPQAYEENTLYLGFDSFLSYNVPFKLEEDVFKNRWSPSLGVSYLMYDLDKPKSSSTDVKLGNSISWDDQFFIKVGAGIRTNIYYSPDLTTGLEFIWALNTQFKY